MPTAAELQKSIDHLWKAFDELRERVTYIESKLSEVEDDASSASATASGLEMNYQYVEERLNALESE